MAIFIVQVVDLLKAIQNVLVAANGVKKEVATIQNIAPIKCVLLMNGTLSMKNNGQRKK